MRNVSDEAAIWYFFTSGDFYEAAAKECDEIRAWLGRMMEARGVVDFGRNNQIYDKFKQRANEFRKGRELADLGDYEFIENVAECVSGDARGILEQPFHSWMSDREYFEFDNIKIARLLRIASRIRLALNNSMVEDDAYFNPDPQCPGRNHDDDGFPGADILESYDEYINWDKGDVPLKISEPKPTYMIDRTVSCKTGDEVPWTGVWYPSTGLDRHSLTFAIKGLRMQPAFRLVKTIDELEAEGQRVFVPQTVAVVATWHPVVPFIESEGLHKELREKAGQPCPKAGIWQSVDMGAVQRRYSVGETMASLGSAYGTTVWRWVSER